MTGLDVAEPQPLWLSLQHTPPFLGISDTPAHAADAAVGAAGILVEVVDEFAVIADSAGLQFHLFPFSGYIFSTLICM